MNLLGIFLYKNVLRKGLPSVQNINFNCEISRLAASSLKLDLRDFLSTRAAIVE